tara:strand:- start:146 stop:1669 length:1524 start_codon:yes stop_codon:yes gene_type:complete
MIRTETKDYHSVLNLKNSFHFLKKFTIISLLIIYFSFNIFAFLVFDTWVPDEKLFWKYIKGFKSDPINVGNTLGYGSIYWWIYIVINHFKSIRLVNYLYLLFIPYIYYLIGKRLNQSNGMIFLSIFILLSFPAFWFYGKIIGPELLSVFLSLLGFYITLLKRNKYWGFFIISVGVGVKINSIVVLIFAFIYKIISRDNLKGRNLFLSELPKIIFFSIFGYVISTPEVVFNTKEIIKNYSYGRLPESSLIQTSLYDVYFAPYRYLWDGIPTSGLFHSSLNLITLFFIVILLIFKILHVDNYKLLFSFLFSFVFGTLMIMFSKAFIWYWFPIIFLIPIAFFSLNNRKKSRNALFFIIYFNLIINAPKIINKVENRMLHQEIISNQKDANDFMSKMKVEKSDYKFLYLTEFGLAYRPKYDSMRFITDLEKKQIRDSSNKLNYMNYDKTPPLQVNINIDSTIVIIGERFLRVHSELTSLIDRNNCDDSSKLYLDLIDNSKFLKAFKIKKCH